MSSVDSKPAGAPPDPSAPDSTRQLQQELAGLLYAVSHDLRAPLRAVSGFTQALKEHAGSNLDETGAHFLQRIQQANQKLSQLLDALLSLSRITQAELQWQEIDLAPLCREAAATVAARYENQSVQFEVLTPLWLRCDPQLLMSAVQQLLDNAWKATASVVDGRVTVSQSMLNGKSLLSVQDNGIGFDMQYAEKLFIPFQHLHATGYANGLGIGLATVQRIATKHNGRAWAHSKPQQGAVFNIELPSHGTKRID